MTDDAQHTPAKTPDGDVSPMEAQNVGPARTGPSGGPLPQTKKGDGETASEADEAAIRKGGEGESRDDI